MTEICDTYECKVAIPWRQNNASSCADSGFPHDGLFFKFDPDDEDHPVTEWAWFGTTGNYSLCHTVYLSTEVDPDIQDNTNDVVLNPGDTFCISGIVQFQKAGSTVVFELQGYRNLETEDESGINPMSVRLYATPGITVHVTGCPDQIFGLQARNECNGPILIGCSEPPNSSHGGLSRNNGGYAGVPAELGIDYAFNICFDLNGPTQITSFSGDFGEGSMATLQWLNDSAHSGGAIYCPGGLTNDHTCDHEGHKVRITASPNGNTTSANPGVILKSLVASYNCVANPDYINPTDDQV